MRQVAGVIVALFLSVGYAQAQGCPTPNGIRRVKDYVIYFAQDRPDVMAHFLPFCPRVHSNTGWAVYPTTPIPSGHRTLWIVMKKASRYVTQTREVDIP